MTFYAFLPQDETPAVVLVRPSGVYFAAAGGGGAVRGARGSRHAARADTLEALADLHLNGKRIDRLSAPLVSLTHRDHTHRHGEAGL